MGGKRRGARCWVWGRQRDEELYGGCALSKEKRFVGRGVGGEVRRDGGQSERRLQDDRRMSGEL